MLARKNALVSRNDELSMLKESLEIAKAVNQVKQAEGGRNPFSTSVVGNSLLYLQGEKYLSSRIKVLMDRESDDPFISELRPLESQLGKLHEVSVDKLGSVMNVNQVAYASEMRIKPKRKLIVVLGAVLGLMLGIFGAFFLNFLENQKQDEE
jgi:chain length determinant protein (polysaccharide antigen chain regulator)